MQVFSNRCIKKDMFTAAATHPHLLCCDSYCRAIWLHEPDSWRIRRCSLDVIGRSVLGRESRAHLKRPLPEMYLVWVSSPWHPLSGLHISSIWAMLFCYCWHTPTSLCYIVLFVELWHNTEISPFFFQNWGEENVCKYGKTAYWSSSLFAKFLLVFVFNWYAVINAFWLL